MDYLNKVLDKVGSLQGTLPSYERPHGLFSDPNTHEYHMAMIFDHAAHNEVTLPIVMREAKGNYMWDVKGHKYLDMMSSYGCANQGHCHPKILEAMIKQASKLPHTSLITHHDQLGPASKHLCERFKYDKILFMNSGAEAVDTAILTARRWGYSKKKIPYGKAAVLFPKHCYWGMILSARSGADDMDRRAKSEPLATEGLHFDFVDYDNTEQLEAKFIANPNICAYIFEPIQGHAGNIHPTPGYYSKVRELCSKYNVLMVSDEIQAGLGRSGKILTCDWENVRPDMVTLGKSLSGGFMPVSAVLGDNEVMNVWGPMEHQSTYAGNPIACALAVAAVDVLFDEGMIENSEKLGRMIEQEFKTYDYPFIVEKQCGKGLFASLKFKDMMTCWIICKYMMKNGILVRPEPGAYLKIMPPLTVTEADLREMLRILKEGLDEYQKKGKLGLVL